MPSKLQRARRQIEAVVRCPVGRAALSLLPGVGPVVNGVEALANGNRAAAAIDFATAAVDVMSCGTLRAGAPRYIGTALRLRHKAKRRVGVISLKFAASAMFATTSRNRWLRTRSQRSPSRRRSFSGSARSSGPPGELADHTAPRHFVACADVEARMHAVMANAAYLLPADRRGILVDQGSNEDAFYAYVGGDAYRGFWFSPDSRRLIMAERGTQVTDGRDVSCDLCLAAGLGSAAVALRVADAHAELQQTRVEFQDTVAPLHFSICGHSLGGTIAVALAAQLRDPLLKAVHVFNPGGLPDLSRSLGGLLCQAPLHVHTVEGDAISAAFLPFGVGARQVSVFGPRPDLTHLSPHLMAHFL